MKYVFGIAILTFTTILLSLKTSAQTKHLTGRITDVANVPLEKALVTIARVNDNSLIKKLLTDRAGNFSYVTIGGEYNIHISALGYADTIISIKVRESDRTVAVQLRALPAILAAVSVTAQKMLIERKADKVVVNIEGSLLNAGNNALEALEQAPGVKIDNGNILLKGKPGVTIFIDDKPAYLQNAELADYLRSLPAAVLDKIEIMSNPSAQYDAAGTGGIINIKLKKGKAIGINGNALAEHTQGRYGRSSQSLNMNIRRNKLNTYFNLGNYNGTGFSDINTERNYALANDNAMLSFDQHSFSTVHNDRVLVKIGADYLASSKIIYGAAFSYMNNDRKMMQAIDSRQAYKSSKDSVLKGDNRSSGATTNLIANVYYRYTYDSLGRELLLDADFIRYKATNHFQNESNLAAASSGFFTKELFSGSVPAIIDIYTAKADYNHPFNKESKIAVGYKFSTARADNDASYLIYKNADVQPVFRSANQFQYREDIHALYVNYSMGISRVTAQLGLRAEYMQNSGHTMNDSAFNASYARLFPTLFFGYKLDKQSNHLLQFSFGRRIERPVYTDLNPFPVPFSRYSFRNGNPYLQPQFSDNYELSYLFKNTLSLSLFYNQLKNGIDETYTVQGDIFNYTMSNINSKKIFGASLDASFTLAKRWSANPVIVFTHTTADGILNGTRLFNAGNNIDISLNQQCNFKNGWNAEMNAGYSTKQVYAQYEQAPTWYIHAGVGKKLWKDKWVIKLNLRDIFYTRIDKQNYTNINMLNGFQLRRWDTRNITIAVGYKFNTGHKATQVKRSTENEEESKRLKE